MEGTIACSLQCEVSDCLKWEGDAVTNGGEVVVLVLEAQRGWGYVGSVLVHS